MKQQWTTVDQRQIIHNRGNMQILDVWAIKLLLVNLGFFMWHNYWSETEQLSVFVYWDQTSLSCQDYLSICSQLFCFSKKQLPQIFSDSQRSSKNCPSRSCLYVSEIGCVFVRNCCSGVSGSSNSPYIAVYTHVLKISVHNTE